MTAAAAFATLTLAEDWPHVECRACLAESYQQPSARAVQFAGYCCKCGGHGPVYDVRQTEAIPRGENLDGGLVIATILLFSAFASFFLICFLAIQYR
jgi:hypothetical protein